MSTSLLRTGVGCRFLGLWLLVTSGMLFWAETAPLVLAPNFVPAVICLTVGAAILHTGCFCRRRTGNVRSSN